MSVVEIDAGELTRMKSVVAHHEEITDSQKKVAKLHDRWMQAKDASLAAKKNYDQAVHDLREMIATGPDNQLKLFSDTGEPAKDWREVSIDRLDISPTQKQKLRDAGCATLGDVETLRSGRNPGFPKGLSSIPRFGATVCEKIESAMLAWLPEGYEAGEASADDEDDEDEAEEPTLVETEEEAEAVAQGFDDEPAEEDDPFSDPVAVDDGWDDDPTAETEAEPEAEASAEKETVRVRLTVDVARMEADGLIAGAEFDAEIHNGTAMIEVNGEATALPQGEYQILQTA